jgi:hypothetical protein
MKSGMYFGLVIVAFMVISTGCQSRRFECIGKGANGHEYAVPANSIDGYAKERGISRAEAAKRMRAEFVPPSSESVENTPEETAAVMQKDINQSDSTRRRGEHGEE